MLNKYLNEPKSFGLVGKTLKHSYSKEIHESFGYLYELFELNENELPSFINSRHFLGLNVTIPYKETVLKFCDEIDDIAKKIGAANTLYFDKSGKLHAGNTDYFGFFEALKLADISLKNKSVAILGTGGTAKTMLAACKDLGATKAFIAGRNPEKALSEAVFFRFDSNFCQIVDINNPSTFSSTEILLNATPVGMFPNVNASPLDLSKFTNCEAVFDAIYNPEKTLLLKQADALKINNTSGLQMLYYQAKQSAKLFTSSQ